MKKLLAIAMLSTLPFSVNAKGFYMQGDLGSSAFHISSNNVNATSKPVFEQRISFGYDFDRFRVAADYTNYGKAKFDDLKVNAKAESIGISSIYDFHINSDLTPYVGGRLIYSKVKLDENDVIKQVNSSSMGIGILGGVQIKLSDELSLNLGLEYNRLASDFGQFGGKVGLRYNF